MVERLKLLPRYLLNLGLLKGLLIYLQVEILSVGKVYFPGIPSRIYLRPNTTDRKVFREVFLFKIYDYPFNIDSGVILDGGANIGLASVFFAIQYKEATIIAIEPESSNFEMLKRNTANYPQIKLIKSALWPSDTFIKIRNLNESKWAFSVEETTENDSSGIKSISIATILESNNIQRIGLIKLDIEGSEKELFQYNSDLWLPRTKYLFIEVHDWLKPGCSQAIFSALSKYPISTVSHGGMLIIETGH